MKFIAEPAGGVGSFPFMNFGQFIGGLMQDLGLSAPELAGLADVEVRTVYKWKAGEFPPRETRPVRVADALQIPLSVFRPAAEGKSTLPAEYRDRTKWRARLAAAGKSSPADQQARIMEWFRSAPLVVQHAVLEVVTGGMEQEYAKLICDYFKAKLTGKESGKRRST